MHVSPSLFMQKVALKVQHHDTFDNPIALSARTLGRLNGILMAPVFQENTLDYMRNADPKTLGARLKAQKDDEDLKRTLLSVDGLDYGDSLVRHMTNRNTTPVAKILGLPTTLLGSPLAAAGRQPHYNPFSDVAVTFGNIPEIAEHELGHAKDFNRKDPLLGDAYRGGMLVENAILGNLGASGGPLAQWAETQANLNVMKQKKTPKERRQMRRRLWPARSTYITGGLMSLALLTQPPLRRMIMEAGPTGAIAATLAPLLAAGVLGRGAAEARNLFDKDPR